MEMNITKTKTFRNRDSLMSIKQFSEICGLEQSTLRYWDDIGLFRPAYRNAENSYRYYAPEQVVQVNFIKVLSNLNIPLKVIANVGEKRTPETILKLMEQQESRLDTELNRLHEAYSTIHTLRNTIQQGINAPDADHISVQALGALPIAFGSENKNQEGQNFHQAFMQYSRHAKEIRTGLSKPIGGWFESMQRFVENPSLPSRFFSVDPRGGDQRAPGKYLVGYTQGYYGYQGDTPLRMAEYAREHRIVPRGPVYVIYLLDEISVKDPSNYLAQICAAI